jgi:hypothetical protein
MGKLNEIPKRLKKFITHDVRKNPILGLYLVIGVMVLSYGIYFAAVMYKDFTSPPEKRVAAKPKVAKVKKPPAAKKPPSAKKQVPTKKEEAPPPSQKESPEAEKPAQKVGEETKVKTTAPEKLETSKWKHVNFPDGSEISYPPDWTKSAVNSDKYILHGVRLQAPGSKASLKCYSRTRKRGDNYAESLKETLKRGGYDRIKEETRKINQQDVVQISGALADKHMVVSIFDHQPDKYFIVRLISSKQELTKLRPFYTAIVDSYGGTTSVVSIEKLEQELEQSIEKKKDYLVGSTVYIKMKNGAIHKGMVIAEDDTSLTLESFRFGGRYSFTVKRQDIEEIIR